MALPLFAVTLFVSAFLLFLVQPMIGKMILPKLGGTPQVWNTCMLFFQTTLLAGYAYTHNLGTRLPTRRQLIVHSVLLLIPLAFLIDPFDVRSWFPDPTGIPVLQALMELAVLVGIPFFVVSTSAPLLQKWFVNTGHPSARDPYFLYGASNLGSLLSLLCYPFLIEPYFALRTQAYIWLGGYVALLAMVAACIAMVWKSPLSLQHADASVPEGSPEMPVLPPDAPPPAPVAQTSTAVKSGPAPGGTRGGITRKKGLKSHGRPAPVLAETGRVSTMPSLVSRPSDAPVNWPRRIRWILLAAVPSSLMLGVTSFISTDLSPFPLIWIVPLALYLLSFILVYLRWPIPWTSSDNTTMTPHALVLYVAQPLSILALCWILLVGGFSFMYMFVCWAAFFATALACHGELARDRPTTRYLTEYFLLMSVGGALGGFLNAIVAPLLFTGVWEFYIALVLSCFVRPILLETSWLDNFFMNTFPSMQNWARDQSDQLSRSFGRPADGSTYVLSYTLDILVFLFMLGLTWLLNTQMSWGWYDGMRARNLLRFVGFTDQAAIVYRSQALFAVIYGIPLVLCFLFSSRPVRFGLAVTALLAMNLLWFRTRGEDEVLFQGRTYFGVLRVLEGREALAHRNDQGKVVPNDNEEFENFAVAKALDADKKDPQVTYRFTYLMHGTTYHGRNYIYREGTDAVDLSRLATTYYHRYGPVGVVMERFNWFPGPQNSFWGDARMPASLVGQAIATIGTGNLAYGVLTDAWSEPPYATIGLGTGTMASYCRPYQHLTYYEIDEQIRNFSLPPVGDKAYFTYLLGAMRRGGDVEVIMGDARLSIEKPQVTLFPVLPYDRRLGTDGDEQSDHPDLKIWANRLPKGREHYYKAINVDAFSSDAIPVHLVTKEAIRLYLSTLTHDGVLCVHTSNRHLDLVQPVARIVEDLDAEFMQEFKEGKRPDSMKHVRCVVGKDQDQRERFLGHFSSEYVMVFYDEKYLKPAKNYVPPRYNIYQDRSVVHWGPPDKVARYPWTDDYSNLVSIMR